MPKWLATVLHVGGEVIQIAAIATVVPGLVPVKIGAIIWAIAKAASLTGLQVTLPNVPPGSALVTVPNAMLAGQTARAGATVAGTPNATGAVIVPGTNPLVAR